MSTARSDPLDRAAFVVSVAVAAVGMGAPTLAAAVDFLSPTQAQKLLFPDATSFVAHPLVVTPEQAHAAAARAGGPVNTALWSVVEARSGDNRLLGYVVQDAVIGKFELIDYAVALAPDAAVRDIQVLAYREAHGSEVRTAAWRHQFTGKSAASPLMVGNDIANISGATLSCTHLTDGVRRIAAVAAVALAGAPGGA